MGLRMAKWIAAAGVAFAACQAGAHGAVPPEQRAAQASHFPSDAALKPLLQRLVENGEATGVILGLLEPDGHRRIISVGSAGEGARPLSGETLYEIGSITKTFTGTILADMVRRGEVSLDDPVAKYLPSDVRVPERGGRQITLLDLATHTSGLPRLPDGYDIPDRSNPFADYRTEHLYEFLSRHELENDIGAKPAYSNLGMGLLGHALARAAGVEDFPALVRQRIIEPLGMRSTAYGRPGELAARMAKGHNKAGEIVPYWDVAIFAGAGGINADAHDMLTYLAANTGAPATELEMAMRDAHRPRRQVNDRGLSIGLGWQTRSRDGFTMVEHGGGTAGFQTHLGFDPSTGAAVVIMGNAAGFDDRDEIVFDLLRGKVPELPAPHAE